MSMRDYWPGRYRNDAISNHADIANLSTAADHGRMWDNVETEPSSPIPGSEWNVRSLSPSERLATMTPSGKALVDEVDAVRLIETMSVAEDTIRSNRLRLLNALWDFRKANPMEKTAMLSQLRVVYDDIYSPDLQMQMEIEDIVKQIEVVAPKPKGYTPHMGIQYALAPIRDALHKLRDYYAKTAG